MTLALVLSVLVNFALLVGLSGRAYRVGLLEGELKAYRDEEVGDDDWVPPPWAQPTSMVVPFNVASRSEIFGVPPLGHTPGLPSRMLGWDGGYRNASGYMQPFPPEPKR